MKQTHAIRLVHEESDTKSGTLEVRESTIQFPVQTIPARDIYRNKYSANQDSTMNLINGIHTQDVNFALLLKWSFSRTVSLVRRKLMHVTADEFLSNARPPPTTYMLLLCSLHIYLSAHCADARSHSSCSDWAAISISGLYKNNYP